MHYCMSCMCKFTIHMHMHTHMLRCTLVPFKMCRMTGMQVRQESIKTPWILTCVPTEI